jgi:protein gp37
MATTKIEWTRADDGVAGMSWNPVRGCTKISPGCAHCLDPQTLVLTEAFLWKPLVDIRVGDVLVGFDEFVQNPSRRGMRMVRPTTVTALWSSRQPAMRVTTDRAEVICSADHRFLPCRSRRWIKAGHFRLGNQLRYVGCRPGSESSDEYAAGYLMGLTDGDGTWRFTPGQRSDKLGYPQCYWRVALTDEEALLAAQRHLRRFGLTAHVRPFRANHGHGYLKPMQRLELRAIPDLTRLDKVLNYCETDDYARGYLAGIFDAEGSFNRANLRISNKTVSYLERVTAYGARLGFDFRIEPKRPNELLNARLYGPRRDRLSFFTLTRPAIRRKARALLGAKIDVEPATVIRLEVIGERDLIDIETTTHTFFANGLATHNCYAETFAERFRGVPGHPYERGFDVRLVPDKLDEPKRWKKPRRVFVNSMSDLFHDDVSDDYVVDVCRTMAAADWHTYHVLTKRSERMRDLLATRLRPFADLPHVWWGVSVEDRRYGLPRVEHLRSAPAARRWLSVEPLLEDLGPFDLTGIAWVVVGGESGHGARPLDLDWVRSVRDQCRRAGAAFFFKQMLEGRRKVSLPLLDGRPWAELRGEPPGLSRRG